MADYDPSEPRHVAIKRRQARADDQARLEFIQYIMGVANGRAYIYDLLVSCHIFTDSLFTPDAMSMSFSSGRHSVGQQIVAEIMAACPDQYVQMMREADARAITIEQRLERSDKDANGGDRQSTAYVHPALDTGEQTNVSSEYDPGDEERGED